MAASDTDPGTERKQTDESLRTEREKTDQAILSKKKILEDDADLVLSRARAVADTVLAEARDKADEDLSPAESVRGDTLADKRIAEDQVLQEERDVADRNIDREREQVNQTLRRLMPLEREATDKRLLTERVSSDTALENRDDFLGMVCHDLRDLLSGVVLNAEFLLLQAPDDEPGKLTTESALQIRRYAARMNRLISDLVDVASIDSGKISVAPSRKDTSLLVSEAVAAYQAAASAKEIVLDVDGLQEPLYAEFDHDRILQVLANLITNAIKFTDQGGAITVTREEEAERIVFSVIDTGSGIPSDVLETIFERFWQVSKTDRRGLGLGLYISKSIVESHNGNIWAESTVGEGSRFYFTLPITPKA